MDREKNIRLIKVNTGLKSVETEARSDAISQLISVWSDSLH